MSFSPDLPRHRVIWGSITVIFITLVTAIGAVTFTPTARATVQSVTPTPSSPADFSGTWQTNIATLTLFQTGNTVSGSVAGYGGTWNKFIDGRVDGHVFQFSMSTILGSVSLVLSDDGRSFASGDRSLAWCGVRSGALPKGCGFSDIWLLSGSAVAPGSYAEVIQTGEQVVGTIYSATNQSIESINGTIYWGKGYALIGSGSQTLGSFTWSPFANDNSFFGGPDLCGWRNTATKPSNC